MNVHQRLLLDNAVQNVHILSADNVKILNIPISAQKMHGLHINHTNFAIFADLRWLGERVAKVVGLWFAELVNQFHIKPFVLIKITPITIRTNIV